MSIRTLVGVVVVAILIIGGYLLWSTAAPRGDYAYRCGDGSEFSMTPAEDGRSITLYPATSVERIPQTTLILVESEFGSRFESESLVFHGQGEGVQLIGRAFSTTCTPISGPNNPPYNWGD